MSMKFPLQGDPASIRIYVEDISMASAADDLAVGDAVLCNILERPTPFVKADFEDEHVIRLGTRCMLTGAYMQESIYSNSLSGHAMQLQGTMDMTWPSESLDQVPFGLKADERRNPYSQIDESTRAWIPESCSVLSAFHHFWVRT